MSWTNYSPHPLGAVPTSLFTSRSDPLDPQQAESRVGASDQGLAWLEDRSPVELLDSNPNLVVQAAECANDRISD